MEEKDKKTSSDPASPKTTEFTPQSRCILGADDSDAVYLFCGDRESSVLSEFGWNFEPEQPNRTGTDDMPDLAGGGGLWISPHSATAGLSVEVAGKSASNNQSISLSSSEDLPERSTGSDGNPPETP